MSDSCTDPAPKYTFGYWQYESKIFRIFACYQEVAHNCKNWDPVYCTTLLIYCMASLANICMLGYVMHYYRKSQL